MKILIIKPSSLGDVIHALPFLKALKDTFPDCLIDWVISSSLKGILEGNPLINDLITINKDDWQGVKNIPKTLGEISSLKRHLRSKHYDMLIDLQGLLRSGLISFFTPASEKIGFADAREGSRIFYDRKITVNGSLHAVDKCLAVARAVGAGPGQVEFPLFVSPAAEASVKAILGGIREYLLITPSARWMTKRWPAEQFASLIDRISLPCVIAGGKGDRGIARSIISRVQEKTGRPLIDLCGKTDLPELTALIAGAKALVSNDSGPMHIAAALNVPTVAIFGPTDPLRTGPYGWQTDSPSKVVRADVSCSPCRRRTCREFICMHRVTVENVYEALKGYL